MKAAIYARVNTVDQQPENQLQELRRYVQARGWSASEYVDHGSAGPRTGGRPSIPSSGARDAGASMSWSAGA